MNSNDITWFEGNTVKTQPQVRFNEKGAISFNTTARKILPEYISFGFDSLSKQLIIREGIKKQGFHVTSTSKPFPALTIHMSQQQVTFPAVYYIQAAADTPNQWVCTLNNNTDTYLTKEIQKLAKVDSFSARTSDFMETLLSLYKSDIRRICRVTAKTIPKDDRYQIAQEGFIQAALHYNPNFHVFPDYALTHTKRYLESHINKYSSSYTEYYPLENTSPDGKSYETTPDTMACDSFDFVLNENTLKQMLTSLEFDVCQKLAEGYKKEEIVDMYHMSLSEYENALSTIRHAIGDICS